VQVYLSLDPLSTEYFLSPRKANQTRERAEELVSLLSDPSYTSPHIAAARAKLSVVESLLAWNASQGKGPWLLGDEPSHADACLWGWYAFSRLNKDTEQVWGHESLPRLGQWVKEVISKGIAKEEELY
jgi:glutathione S-transferase